MKKRINWITVFIMMWACMPGLVSAHAYIAQSAPYQDAELTESPTAIRIKFTEKIDTKLSSISLKRIDNGAAIEGELSGEGDLTLIYTIPKLENGVYEASWQVLSLDSHMTDGSFQFAVGVKLEHTKPDDTVSLDGNGNNGAENGTGSGAAATDKPASTVKPEPTKKPSSTPRPTAVAKPSAAPTAASDATVMPSSSSADSDSTAKPASTPDAAAAGNSGSGNGGDASPLAAGAEPSDSTPPQTDAAGGNQPSSHGDHSGSSHAEEGEHEHAGGHGSMVTLRVLDILTSVLLMGILFFRYVIWRDGEKKVPFGFSLRAERMGMGAAVFVWLISGLTRLSMLSEQFGGVSLYELASGTMIGKMATLRTALAILALLLAFAPSRERRWANPIKSAAASAIIVTFPLTGHAYAAVEGAAAAILAHTVHMAAAAIWFGGLAGLLSLTFEKDAAERLNQAAVRFSVWALPSMVFIMASGIWLAAARLSAWEQLLAEPYGRLIAAKICFMLLVLVIAAFHRLVFMPRIAQGSAGRGLLLGIRAEVLLAVALFVLAGWLSSTSPPADAAQKLAEPIYWHVMGDKAHMSMRISENEQSKEQSARLDVWLPEGQGAAASIVAVVVPKENKNEGEVMIPLKLQPRAAELYEYPGFTKYTYLASGEFIDDRHISLITIDVLDGEGNSFHYERVIGEGVKE
ncbi:CopD family protein [Paenibacillus sp. LHD-38]|uniref:CopD family protein n=1 Tax=Paenibacillus sp. LHD-38 TaxID=3072143 RepID=UPI00280EF7A9|nr:CopD family protein [Paenibacillus sp. LHD-38]MDQ8732992.1 CopD family protein [Paenibacillus sp. LHD-38]